MTKAIQVQGVGNDKRVILWERHADHPRGEVFVSNDGKPHTVAETAAVKRLIGEGRLMAVHTQTTPTSQQTPPTQTQGTEPWPGYGEATVEQIVERLRGMDATERERALAYERSSKARKGIVGPDVNWAS